VIYNQIIIHTITIQNINGYNLRIIIYFHILMINCDHCGMIFKFPSQLERHLSRKFPCFSKLPPQTNDNSVVQNNYTEQNVYDNDQNIKDEYKCSKCNKCLSTKSSLKRHIRVCNGCHVLQCPTCLKYFSSASSKSQHIKNGKCTQPEGHTPPIPQEPKQPPTHQTINNITNIHNRTDARTDARTLNNNNIYIVNFSDTDYSHISIEQIVKMVSKCQASPSRFFNMMIMEAHKNEYANVGLSNIRGNYVTIFDDQQFLKFSAEEIAEEIGIKIVHRMDDCITDTENKEIIKQGNIFRWVKSYSWIEDVVRGIPADEYHEETSDALRTLNMRKKDAADKINASIRFGLHNVNNNMKQMMERING
jgi:hypothetical protein